VVTNSERRLRGIEYILGARGRSDNEVREIVLADRKPMMPLVITRARGAETLLTVKEVMVGDWGPGSKPRRYVVCFNADEAKHDAAVRAVIIDSLRVKLQQGDKQLVGNAGYRRFLRHTTRGTFRDRRSADRRGCPLRRALRAAHQRQDSAMKSSTAADDVEQLQIDAADWLPLT
jgi:hypothetical protein